MAEIKTYRNGDKMGTFSQLNFVNGEKILISIAQSGIKISKLGFLFFPTSTIYETKSLDESFKIFTGGSYDNFGLLDSVIGVLINCNSINEAKKVLDNLKS